MALPEVIPIVHEPGYHTDTIGTFADGQFFANIHGAHPNDDTELDLTGERLRWYVYLHVFDHDGHHLRSDITRVGIAPILSDELRAQAKTRLDELLDQLPGRAFGDIAIRLFSTTFDGVTFGLIDESAEHAEAGDDEDEDDNEDEAGWAELYPEGLGFGAPWNGEYDT